jgi:hypothetical protein
MRKSILVACAAALAVPFSTAAAGASVSGPAHVAASSRAAATIVVGPGQSIQAAVNRARPGDTVLVKRGIYHQDVQIRTNGITLRGAGNSWHGTVLVPPAKPSHTACNGGFGPTGVCVLAKKVNVKTGKVLEPVRNDTVTGLFITGFAGNGVFGYGTSGMTVVWVTAVKDGGYGISRFVSTKTLFAHDTAVGNSEAGFYVGDSPQADTVVRDNVAFGNQFGVFIRHARHVLVVGNHLDGNCQGVIVLDDGQRGGAGDTVIGKNLVHSNNKFCAKHGSTPINLQGGGILLLGATRTLVIGNDVTGNAGGQLNSGGIVVASASKLSHGSNPKHDTIAHNTAFRNKPADLIWDGSGVGIHFLANRCQTSIPKGLCHY